MLEHGVAKSLAMEEKEPGTEIFEEQIKSMFHVFRRGETGTRCIEVVLQVTGIVIEGKIAKSNQGGNARKGRS